MKASRDTPRNTSRRITARVIVRNHNNEIVEILEQEIPASMHDVGLLLRRDPFRTAIGRALLSNGAAKAILEVRK